MFANLNKALDAQRETIALAYRMDEEKCLQQLIDVAQLRAKQYSAIQQHAKKLLHGMKAHSKRGGIEYFLQEYGLSSVEGIALMCLAESLLRIPDKDNRDRLIKEKLGSGDWYSHLHQSESFSVNATTWGLMLTGKILAPDDQHLNPSFLKAALKNLISKGGEPLIRRACGAAMKIMSRQFIIGRTIEEAISRAAANKQKKYGYSYDMLGESALTTQDAKNYFKAYEHAIDALAAANTTSEQVLKPSISIKLSALYPRFSYQYSDKIIRKLVPKVFALAMHAKKAGIDLTIDAEYADTLDLTLDIFDAIFSDPSLDGWEGFGLAVQSYQKRAVHVIDWLVHLSVRHKRRIPVRLIKGAYWDTEIKDTQVKGLQDYPVFTRKCSTDISFQACVKKIFKHTNEIYPQFATHNAYSIATVIELAGEYTDYEFQCLHGMGAELYDALLADENNPIPCRIYAPVGSHEKLLPYLVRRLLENGANTSFINQVLNPDISEQVLLAEPIQTLQRHSSLRHDAIPKPKDIFSSHINSAGFDFSDHIQLNQLASDLEQSITKPWTAAPILDGNEHFAEGIEVRAPYDHRQVVGHVQQATLKNVSDAFSSAEQAFVAWDATTVLLRAELLEKTAELYEHHSADLIALIIHEAGKTLQDANSDLREAIDFCRYYAACAREQFAVPEELVGYTGETNHVYYHGRGVIACISPWNFPLAIFTGQIAAALVSGNVVIAKPAEQTSLVAALAVRLFHAAGIPGGALQLLPGSGEEIGNAIISDPRLKAVLFTGSLEVASQINRNLAHLDKAITPVIAETGGQNAMIVDSSALIEQVVEDVIESAFNSAGQRCSALRVLYLQEEIADEMITMLSGAMAELNIGSPQHLKTDVASVIDESAQKSLENHLASIRSSSHIIYQCALPDTCQYGSFFAPVALEINSIEQLEHEVFGPVLHIIRFNRNKLDCVVDAINQTGYGLTLGVHSRIGETVDYIIKHAKVGNIYVNRNITGAVVGLQPFGGEGLSGTGPKAGGKNYLKRLMVERTVTVNTTATGGNPSLLNL